jgi:DHA1 family bicyclomycin/chloramphenicol resistance-like MFS transporter
LNKQQPILGKKGTMLFLVLISAFPPLTIDLYLPALPLMAEAFNTTQAKINLTLSIYFLLYAIGLLFWGPLSEKYGRKPIVITGISIYILSSVACALAENIESLIVSRVFQAFGGSAVTVVATAIVKDLYDGRAREKIMASIMSLVIIAPMVAPSLGAFILSISSWRVIFLILSIFGVISMILAICYRESLESRYTGNLLSSWGRLTVVLKNPRFIQLLGVFSITPMALMAFLAASSYIYIDRFGFTEQQFGYTFAFNACVASVGPSLYILLSKHISRKTIISLCFGLLTLSGTFTFLYGSVSPWLFMILVGLATLSIIAMRVPGMNLMLDQHDKDTGSAVAIIQFSSMILGSIGIALVSLRPEGLIENLGVIQILIGVIGVISWRLVQNNFYNKNHSSMEKTVV